MENTIQSWVEMQCFVVTDTIGLLSRLLRIYNRLLTLFFIKRFHENLSDLEIRLATSLMEVMFVRERHFTFPEYFTLFNAQLTEIIYTIATL